jgi:hypothetical protein
MESAIQLDIFFDNLITIKKLRKPRPAGRAKDSSGRFAIDVELPGKEEFNAMEARKNESIALMIRLLTEENIRLKDQLKKYGKDG